MSKTRMTKHENPNAVYRAAVSALMTMVVMMTKKKKNATCVRTHQLWRRRRKRRGVLKTVLSTVMSTMAKTASTRMMKMMTACHGSESSMTRNRPRDRLAAAEDD